LESDIAGSQRRTILNFAESRVLKRRTTTGRFPVMKENKRVWMEVEDMAPDNGTHSPSPGIADRADFASDYFERTL
jgi:hypothetical protein